jgi:hypothetical protein
MKASLKSKVVPDKQGKIKEKVGRGSPPKSTRWKPGQSGNPAGRPKSITLSEALRLELAKASPEGDGEQTYAEAIAAILCQTAATGNILAAKEIADRTEGKPKQAVDMTMNVNDWRELARQHGVSQEDVLLEARRLIEESVTPGSGASGH